MLAKFTSRKFLLALSAAIALIANKQYTEAMYVVIGYFTAEGAIDATRKRQTY